MVTRNMEKTMDHRLDRLIEIQHEVYDLLCVALAGWDQSVTCRQAARNDRADILGRSQADASKRTSDERAAAR